MKAEVVRQGLTTILTDYWLSPEQKAPSETHEAHKRPQSWIQRC